MSLKHGLLGLLNYGNMMDMILTEHSKILFSILAGADVNLPGVKHNGKLDGLHRKL